MRYLRFTLLPLLLVACTDQEPVAPDASPLFNAGKGMNKTPISGTIVSVAEPPDEKPPLVTPSGMCHIYDSPGITEFTGDVAGTVTFYREVVNVACSFDPDDIGSFAGHGPVYGEVTFLDRTGTIQGMWTTNCKADPVTVWSCDGTINFKGSGELDKVQFHIKWGPGYFPFPYSGTAFYK
ncbi:MAG: hypothetical protein AMS21_11995 [Gemmatimonas sp. SG8_38_2]|nr:MAG: hypothetical protein AMS21_11995 [Gemmatimonas sp. SG8_38_2]